MRTSFVLFFLFEKTRDVCFTFTCREDEFHHYNLTLTQKSRVRFRGFGAIRVQFAMQGGHDLIAVARL